MSLNAPSSSLHTFSVGPFTESIGSFRYFKTRVVDGILAAFKVHLLRGNSGFHLRKVSRN